jgi:hypothetical protein
MFNYALTLIPISAGLAVFSISVFWTSLANNFIYSDPIHRLEYAAMVLSLGLISCLLAVNEKQLMTNKIPEDNSYAYTGIGIIVLCSITKTVLNISN